MTEKELLTFLEKEYSEVYVRSDSLPKPYVGNQEIKAILLGTDPTNPSKEIFEYVFGLNNSKRNYKGFLESNLKILPNLDLNNLYIQNLCKNYFTKVTSENKSWRDIAKHWAPLIKEEFDNIFEKNVPVLISAEVILDVVLIGSEKKQKADYYYKNACFIDESINIFDRVLIPFYRNHNYRLLMWDDYKNKIDSFFGLPGE